MNWEEYLFAGAVITVGLCFSGMMLIEWATKRADTEARRKYWLLPLLCVLAITRANGGQTIKDSFTAKESELQTFEDKTQVVLTLEKPMYRTGEILMLKDGRYCIPISSHFDGKQWQYTVVGVKVEAK